MATESVLSLFAGPYELLIMVFLWSMGLIVLVLPVIYAVFAIKERRRILAEIESLRREVRDLGLKLEAPLRRED